MSDEIRLLLESLRRSLQSVYGGRLRGLYLYGSLARGDAAAGADLDLLIVLDRVDAYADELARTSALVSEHSLSSGRSVSRVFLPLDEWREGDSPFLRNVREEAIAA